MIDVHTHILPNVDDGASSEEMAVAMLDILETTGVTDVFLTPHFYSDMESLDDFVLKRNNAYEKFKDLYKGNVKLHLGSEVYLTQYLTRYEDLSEVCLDKTQYMLVELPFDRDISEKTCAVLESLVYDYKTTPIIAHIERYPFFSYNRDLIQNLISLGCLIQVNSDSFVSKKMRKSVLSLLEQSTVNFIGSDSHDLKNRPPTYSQAIDIIKSKLGEDVLREISIFENKLLIK